MAVKQNNTEANGSSADANQVNGTGVKSTGTITKSKKMNTNGTNSDGGGGGGLNPSGLGVTSNAELPGCSGNTGAFAKTKKLNASASANVGGAAGNAAPMVSHQPTTDIVQILQLIELVEKKQQEIDLSKTMMEIYRHLILKLARVQIPRQSAEDLKRFKEDIAKVGAFFAKNNEKVIYYHTFLPLVSKLITMSDGGEQPSCALAVIFQLFSTDMIFEAVQTLLDDDVPDQSIRKTVGLLCEWLRICNFCQNLNIWIMAILNGLQKQHKTTLVDQIALENIDHLFSSLMVPVLRPKVAPIVFHMLSTDQTPEVFHKIIPRFARVITMLKQQSNSSEEYAESTKAILKQLVDRTSALMVRFYRYDDKYESIEMALKDFQPSSNYLSYAYGNKTFDSTGVDNYTNQGNAKVGLVNLGNTCYMNSVLQALAMTKEFTREILLSESKSPLLIKMQQQIALMLYSTRQELTPSKVLNATRPPGFSPGLQQDSSEFLGYLLETLHEQEMAFFKMANKNTGYISPDDARGASALCKSNDNGDADGGIGDDEDLDDDDEELKEAGEQQKSINIQNSTTVNMNSQCTQKTTTTSSTSTPKDNTLNHSSSKHLSQAVAAAAKTVTTATSSSSTTTYSTIEKTFTGKLATTYKCLTCGWKSCNIDSFRDLQLSFPDVKNDCASNYSVQDLIEYYCSSEKLYGDNQYFCERCKKLSDAERYINVISAPKNLILTLKHFKYDQKYHMRAKLMHKVFHDEKVSLKVCSPQTLEEIATVHYDIYAGVVHSGFSMDSGHYYTYAADATNKWYKFNDSIVTPSRTEELHNLTPPNTPYILFYQMGARSNETPETSASTKVIKVDVPSPLTLEELPRDLREMVNHDNYAFAEEMKMRRFKANATMATAAAQGINKNSKNSRRDSFDDDDDEQPPPASGCGGNSMLNNMNRFVY
ncbi:ubiquitin carboxyl-terminal hydrolase 35 [Musca vetustissima]|uniref:ubiquitin carboxyl-terminal hydrolase 35 n=1 Tax=Musca vetustissima TaxID=27455 RepID=UPI002AB73C0C|nr:ubiquitin carboxyl-terminal hydrolase 35 [Musca vetustissima]